MYLYLTKYRTHKKLSASVESASFYSKKIVLSITIEQTEKYRKTEKTTLSIHTLEALRKS